MKTYLSIIVHFIFFCMLILQSTSAQQKKYSLWYNRPAPNKGYETLRKEHIADYQSFFNRVNLHLCDEVPVIPTDSLLHNNKRGRKNLYMEELLFQYGRYLLIASSRQGSLPPNLQGAWSQYEHVPWSGGYWHNINIQMSYWPVFNTNLAELFIPYVEYNEAFRKSAREQAIKYITRNNRGRIIHNTG